MLSDHIPNLLKSKLGSKFEGDVENIARKLYNRILNTLNEDLLEQNEVSRKKKQGFCIRFNCRSN